MVTTQDETIEVLDMPLHIRSQDVNIDPYGNPASSQKGAGDFTNSLCRMTWPELEKEYVVSLLKKNNWNITWAAKTSGINRSTFASRMRKLNIRRNRQPLDE